MPPAKGLPTTKQTLAAAFSCSARRRRAKEKPWIGVIKSDFAHA